MDRSKFLRGLAAVMALGFACTAPLMAADASKPSSKWKMQFDHWAENDGEVVFRIAPATGEPTDVTVKIPKGTSENNVADIVAGSLKGSLGGGYKVEVEDGEKVFVKAKGKTPKFVLSVVSNSATGLNVKLKGG